MEFDTKDFKSADKPYNKIKFNLKIKFKKQISNIYKENFLNKLSSINYFFTVNLNQK